MVLDNDLPYVHVSQLEKKDTANVCWLVESLWLEEAVGIIGAAPKSCKSWLSLDIAVSVASATPCLGKFPVQAPGNTLVYLAEDSVDAIRARLEGICFSRNLNLADISLYLITANSLRLDSLQDQERLTALIDKVKPRLLVLDPLVRLHNSDENNAAEMSKLLSYLRALQRQFHMAIILVHHAGKKVHARAGLSLRGSSDLHAFGDSNLYLFRKNDRIQMTIEHRSAAAIEPITFLLRENDRSAHLVLESSNDLATPENLSIEEQIVGRLETAPLPLTREKLRAFLRVKNERLGEALVSLENRNVILRTSNGWKVTQPVNLSVIP